MQKIHNVMMQVNWVNFPAQKSIDFSQTACLKITDLSGKK